MSPQWIDLEVRRGVRTRRLDGPVPQELSLELVEYRDLLVRWVRDDANRRTRSVLLQQCEGYGIEQAEATCERLLRAGWIERRERLVGGHWQWEWIAWRDLERLQQLLGVSGKRHRLAQREGLIGDASSWVDARKSSDDGIVDPEFLERLDSALRQLSEDRQLKSDALSTRITLLKALAEWYDSGAEGMRRDFALKALGTTKAVGEAEWRWLDACFDLERLRISHFAPMLWIAGKASLRWGSDRVDLAALHVAGLPISDIRKLQGVDGPLSGYWLIENRASFERQAQSLAAHQILLWLPGRPSAVWIEAVAHLVQIAPAPARISADADPAGVDIACTAGAIWHAHQQMWRPYRMGARELESTSQRWSLNEHDRKLLLRLSSRGDLPPELTELCEAMQREGRKAEQESWL